MYHLGLQHRVYAQTLQPEMASIMQDLTSHYIYFSISFCQNNVKKICKSFFGFSLKIQVLGSREEKEIIRMSCRDDLSYVTT